VSPDTQGCGQGSAQKGRCFEQHGRPEVNTDNDSVQLRIDCFYGRLTPRACSAWGLATGGVSRSSSSPRPPPVGPAKRMKPWRLTEMR